MPNLLASRLELGDESPQLIDLGKQIAASLPPSCWRASPPATMHRRWRCGPARRLHRSTRGGRSRTLSTCGKRTTSLTPTSPSPVPSPSVAELLDQLAQPRPPASISIGLSTRFSIAILTSTRPGSARYVPPWRPSSREIDTPRRCGLRRSRKRWLTASNGRHHPIALVVSELLARIRPCFSRLCAPP